LAAAWSSNSRIETSAMVGISLYGRTKTRAGLPQRGTR
jgi:hypothetical protein